MTDEQPLVEKEAWNDFYENGYSACLGIALCFQPGARLGEMVALKWSDIDDGHDEDHAQNPQDLHQRTDRLR